MYTKNSRLMMNGDKIVVIGGGMNDTTGLANIIKNNDLKYLNNCFGSTGVANNGSMTKLPVNNNNNFWDIMFYNLKLSKKYPNGYPAYRAGFHDSQTTLECLNADETFFLTEIRRMCKYAELHSVKLILTMGGMSDKNTWKDFEAIFDSTSSLYKKFVARCAATADVLGEFEDTVICMELVNEPDYSAVVEGYWKAKYGTDYGLIVTKFAEWQKKIIADVKALRKKNTQCMISMGAAIDSSIYPMAWPSEITTPNIILKFWDGCDVPCVHTYINENYPNHWDVWQNQKLPAFVAAAKALGKPLIIGETGRHWEGGTYDSTMDAKLWMTDITEYFWMVRYWNPTTYQTPAFTDVGDVSKPPEVVVVPPVEEDDDDVVVPPVEDDQPATVMEIELSKIITSIKTTSVSGEPLIIYVVKG